MSIDSVKINTSLVEERLGMYQEIHPSRAVSIESVEINEERMRDIVAIFFSPAGDKINFVVWELLGVVWADLERWRQSCLRATPLLRQQEIPPPGSPAHWRRYLLPQLLLPQALFLSNAVFLFPSRNPRNGYKYDDSILQH